MDIAALLKKYGVPATFAYVGVRASAALGAKSQLTQVAAGIGMAGVGLYLAAKVG